jgi:hypothetical protein
VRVPTACARCEKAAPRRLITAARLFTLGWVKVTQVSADPRWLCPTCAVRRAKSRALQGARLDDDESPFRSRGRKKDMEVLRRELSFDQKLTVTRVVRHGLGARFDQSAEDAAIVIVTLGAPGAAHAAALLVLAARHLPESDAWATLAQAAAILNRGGG